MRYHEWTITFAEIPDETTLCVTITNCPHNCKGCHSPYLRENGGHNFYEIMPVIEKYKDEITCFCFMGGDADHDEVFKMAKTIKELYPQLKIAMYSGDDEADVQLFHVLDYYKVGSWQADKGPLNSKTTNQILWHKTSSGEIENITYKFWKEKK